MPETTDNLGLTKLRPGDNLSANGYAFIDGNIDAIDSTLASLLQHDHTGSASVLADPATGPTLTLTTTSGTIPAGTTVRYRFTWVDQFGAETAASPETTVDTAALVQSPAAPSAVIDNAAGSLVGGKYVYALSAYETVTTQETTIADRTQVSVAYTSGTNTITLTLPSLPSGATGFNVYRRAPGEATFSFLASTTGSSYVDDGTVTAQQTRQPSQVNTTNGSNNVQIDLPEAIPADAVYWKIYRSYTSNNWAASDLHLVTEETFVGSGIVVTSYTDFGNGTGLLLRPDLS